MIQFEYIIKDNLGIHARPAGNLAKLAKEFKSEITIKKGETEVSAKKLIAVMGLAVKQNEKITIIINGADEEEAYKKLKEYIASIL